MPEEIMCCNDSYKIGVTGETNFNGSPRIRKEEKNEDGSKMRKEEKNVSVEYIKGQHFYRILVPLAHIFLSFCIRIGAFDLSHVFVLVQVFRVSCTLFIGVRVQRANVDLCG